MSVAIAVLLALAVLIAWLSAAAFVRLRTPFEQLHVIPFVNIAAGLPIIIAAWLADGVSSRSLKCLFLWIVTLAVGALLAHVTARALRLREGEGR